MNLFGYLYQYGRDDRKLVPSAIVNHLVFQKFFGNNFAILFYLFFIQLILRKMRNELHVVYILCFKIEQVFIVNC